MKAYNLKVKSVMFGQTQGQGILLGEEGRNRTARKIKCSESIADGAECKYKAPKIGFGSIVVGVVGVNSDNANNWLARISTEGSYVRGANGNLSCLNGAALLIVSGLGKFGDAGNTGRWQDGLLVVPAGETIRVKPSRGNPYFLVFGETDVEKFTQDDWISMGGNVDRSEGWVDIADYA